ncbi:MAG: oxidoreductase, partial [Clostridium paraputrificum]
IYPMVALFGKPNYIKADAYMLNTGVDGEGSVVFNYDDMMGTIQYSKISNSYIPSEIQGEEGSIIIEQINSFNKITIRYRDGREEVISNEQFEKESMFYEVEEFIKIIKEGKRESEINSHENSLNTMKIMDEVRKQIGLVYLAD